MLVQQWINWFEDFIREVIYSQISSNSLFSFGIYFFGEQIFFENVNSSENNIISVELAQGTMDLETADPGSLTHTE